MKKIIKQTPIVVKNFVIIFLIYLLVGSCRQFGSSDQLSGKDNTIRTQFLSMLSPVKQKRLSDYLILDSIIALETIDQSLIRDISKIFIKNDTLIVIDLKTMSVKVFHIGGHYLYSISTLGRGPGEYTYMRDVCLSKDWQSIWITDTGGKKLINYTIAGKFLGEIGLQTLNAYPEQSLQLKDGSWAFYMDYNTNQEAFKGEGNNNLIITDEQAQYVKQVHCPIFSRSNYGGFSEQSYMSFNRSTGSILVNQAFSDTVFEWDHNVLLPKYSFQFIEKREDLQMDDPTHWDVRMREGHLWSPIFENDQIFSFRCIYKGKVQGAFWHRKREELLTEESFDNSELLLHLFPPKGMTADGRLIGAIIPAWFYLGYTTERPGFMDYLKTHYPSLYEATLKMKDTDNPVLVYYRIL